MSHVRAEKEKENENEKGYKMAKDRVLSASKVVLPVLEDVKVGLSVEEILSVEEVLSVHTPAMSMPRLTSILLEFGANTEVDHKLILKMLVLLLSNTLTSELIVSFLPLIPNHSINIVNENESRFQMPNVYLEIPEQIIVTNQTSYLCAEANARNAKHTLPSRAIRSIQYFASAIMKRYFPFLGMKHNNQIIPTEETMEIRVQCLNAINVPSMDTEMRCNMLVFDRIVRQKEPDGKLTCTMQMTICSKISCQFCHVCITPMTQVNNFFCSAVCQTNSYEKEKQRNVYKRIKDEKDAFLTLLYSDGWCWCFTQDSTERKAIHQWAQLRRYQHISFLDIEMRHESSYSYWCSTCVKWRGDHEVRFQPCCIDENGQQSCGGNSLWICKECEYSGDDFDSTIVWTSDGDNELKRKQTKRNNGVLILRDPIFQLKGYVSSKYRSLFRHFGISFSMINKQLQKRKTHKL